MLRAMVSLFYRYHGAGWAFVHVPGNVIGRPLAAVLQSTRPCREMRHEHEVQAMRITVRLGEPLWRAAGVMRLTLDLPQEPVTVADVLAALAARHAGFESAFRGEDLGHFMPYQVFVNASLVTKGEAHRRTLQDGDKVHIFLPAAGGSQGVVLPREFYQQPTLLVARQLLGARLVRCLDGQRLSGRIVEVEAYVGEEDQASHAAGGPTPRNRSMYSPAGLAYVYLIYGMYHCFNVVTEREGFPAAILIRAIEPLEGTQSMAARRAGQTWRRLADGPGKLCQALAIDRSLDGHDLTTGVQLWLEAGPPLSDSQVERTPRINVRGDDRARSVPWRFRWTSTGHS